MTACGWPATPTAPSSPAPIIAQARSSRLWSRSGSTTAPCGARAMAAISRAVARLAPVEPAMIVGPRGDPVARARISFSTRSAPRRARSIRPRSSSQAGHCAKAILRKSRVMRQYGSKVVGHEIVEPLRVDALDDHVVDQRGEVARQRVGLRRARRHQRRLAFVEHLAPVGLDAADRAAQRLAPGAGQSGERHAAGEFADGGRRDLARRFPRARRSPVRRASARRRRAARCAAG